MEEKVIRPFYHNHPLILKKNVSDKEEGVDCYGCGNLVANLEMAYVCIENNCSSSIILHKKCGELPYEIRHPKHPDHPVHLFDYHGYQYQLCHFCLNNLRNQIGYNCGSCSFQVDIACGNTDIIYMLVEERKELQHPSHLDHPLTLMRKPALAFRCDGCGDRDVDMAYICSTCEFWVHRRCAELPLHRECRHHHHHLSLAFSFPKEHRKYAYKCGVCDKSINRSCWVYFCGNCKYFVHINCVGSTTTPDSNNISEDEKDGVIRFPLNANDVSDKLITPFVMRQKGLDIIPTPTSSLFLPNYHNHPLSLVSQEANSDDEEEETNSDGEEELVKICDVCVKPISPSSPYYHCPTSSCTYFIHSICSMLPNTFQYSSSPNFLQLYGNCQAIPNKNHNFTLDKPKGWYYILFWDCDLCYRSTNGIGYKCEECGTKIDVKCASLPTTIVHSSHTRHQNPLILTRIPPQQEFGTEKKCDYCKESFYNRFVYCCSSSDCDFALHSSCALLPRSITDHEWDDKHPLLLTFDVSHDHPSDFYCEFCEEEMNPKKWMYHCRQCDISLHRLCLEFKSGAYGNMKLGRRYELKDIHPTHPLTFTYVTLKQFCDVCHRKAYEDFGLECASCYFVACYWCGLREFRE